MSSEIGIHIDPEIQGGTPCFTGTRVPVQSLFDSLARGRSLDYFLKQFPSVKREQASQILKQAGKLVSRNQRRFKPHETPA